MPCLGVIIALFAPRLLMILLWIFTDWFKGVFGFFLWPVLGFLFLPTTTLWYGAVQNWWHGDWGLIQIVGLVIALFIDFSPTRRRKKHRRLEQD